MKAVCQQRFEGNGDGIVMKGKREEEQREKKLSETASWATDPLMITIHGITGHKTWSS